MDSVNYTRSSSRTSKPIPAPVSQEKMTDPFRPTWFVARGNGILVPVIAVDELPANITLVGAPRAMTVEDVRQGMTSLGHVPFTGRVYSIENNQLPVDTSTISYNVPDAFAMTQQPQGTGQDHVRTLQTQGQGQRQLAGNVSRLIGPSRPAIVQRPNVQYSQGQESVSQSRIQGQNQGSQVHGGIWSRGQQLTASEAATQATIDAIAGNPSRNTRARGALGLASYPLPPSGVDIDEERKKYCSYWIRHGECDFIQQGCRYLHEMPDPVTLSSLGIRSIPRWYREAHGMGIFNPHARDSSPANQAQTWRNLHTEASPPAQQQPGFARTAVSPTTSAASTVRGRPWSDTFTLPDRTATSAESSNMAAASNTNRSAFARNQDNYGHVQATASVTPLMTTATPSTPALIPELVEATTSQHPPVPRPSGSQHHKGLRFVPGAPPGYEARLEASERAAEAREKAAEEARVAAEEDDLRDSFPAYRSQLSLPPQRFSRATTDVRLEEPEAGGFSCASRPGRSSGTPATAARPPRATQHTTRRVRPRAEKNTGANCNPYDVLGDSEE
ncbi:MAG: hypothetical protein M1827_003699 [Pycnora praestabilis]|nr:MAG: hypothetical protein M1827_003699 [Pycnora praestabilis]